jgi:hypothetical protein
VNKSYLAAITFVALILAGGTVLVATQEGPGCEERYDDLIDGQIDSTELPDQCRPIPEDVENQVLINAFQE